MADELTEDVQTALFDLQRYLLDQIPPITAVEAVETLMGQPPQLLMRQVNAWMLEQSRLQSVPASDFLFHALKKVHMTGELKLLDRTVVTRYLDSLIPLAMQLCPPEDRELLRSSLLAMRDSRNIAATKIDVAAQRIGGAGAAARSKASSDGGDAAAQTARRLSLVIDRLSRQLSGAGAAPGAPPAKVTPQAAAQLVTMAAASSADDEQLKDYMERIRPLTGQQQDANVFHILGEAMPSWEVIPDKPAPQVKAMKKIISLAGNPLEGGKRFRELLTAAVEQFNNGALSAAIAMLELAELSITEMKLDPVTVDRVRGEAVDSISSEQLKKYAENRSKHALLRKALRFFPTLTMENLFEQLRGEARPERRRSLLGLLEAYGSVGRAGALSELDIELKRPAGEVDTYYLRNLIYLLHRIPRESDQELDKELDALARSSAPGQSIYVIKEAATALAQMKSEACVKLLTMRLAEFESMLVRNDTSQYPVDEMQKLLDRITGALSRIGTPAALRTLARHGMAANPQLGDTRARLSALAQHDLSFDEETVNVMVKAIRDDLPGKLLGRLIPKRAASTVRLIEALAGTKSEAVEKLLAEIAERFPDQELGRAASQVLSDRAAAAKTTPAGAAASLTGELEFFGLPSLMQSLAEARASGMVTLSSKQGQTAGKLLILEGKFLNAQVGNLKGVDALYQMLERPIAGSFAFVPQPADRFMSKAEPLEIIPLLFEGIRRHDELKEACAVVPDEISLKPTSVRPTPPEDEQDPAFVRDVWLKASSGSSVGEWEAQIAADAYRVRRLLAHWLEQGALTA